MTEKDREKRREREKVILTRYGRQICTYVGTKTIEKHIDLIANLISLILFYKISIIKIFAIWIEPGHLHENCTND